MNKFNLFLIAFITIVAFLVLSFSVRGNPGNPSVEELDTPYWKENGPFELSPERGRFILTYSLLENHSFQFSEGLARFASPDVAVTNEGKYVSLFAPTVSFITMPGFLIGKYFGISQVGTFFVVSLFAILNFLLIIKISNKLGINFYASIAGGLIFLFATPAFSYAVNLYQHHISTFLILASIYLLLNFKNFISLFLIFLFSSLALSVDYPNLFMMFPIGLVAVFKIISFHNLGDKLKVKIKPRYILSLTGILIPLIFFLWFNNLSYGSPFQLSGTLKTIRDLETKGIKITNSLQGAQPNLDKVLGKKKDAIGFFRTRNLTNGFYIHFLSPDRGILYFAPVIFFAIGGIIIAYRKKIAGTALLLAVIGINILLYSMWTDPWGGWAFGSRYLIPSYALLSIFIGLFLSYFAKKIIVIILVFLVFIYSAFVNTIGAVTSSANPPRVEVLALEELSGKVQKYTFERNIDYLKNDGSKSYFYRVFAKNYVTGWQYALMVFSAVAAIGALVFALNYLNGKKI